MPTRRTTPTPNTKPSAPHPSLEKTDGRVLKKAARAISIRTRRSLFKEAFNPAFAVVAR
jgi:hypothetical protein